MSALTYNKGLHRVALITLAATFPLIFMGGLVTSHGAGLSVPDWPNSYGYNMFKFPPRFWVGGILYEHTHRLMASVVGMLAILLCAWAWVTDRRPMIRWLATGVLAGVIFQGILGGLRVVLVKHDLAVIHACVAQAFFCLVMLIAAVTSRWWSAAPDLSDSSGAMHGRRLIVIASLTVIAIYGQLIVGAIMRHEGAGLAVTDLPLIYGKFLPPTTAAQLNDINTQRAWSRLGLHAVTLGQIWIHYTHRVGALIVTLMVLALTGHVFVRRQQRAALMIPAVLLIMLLFTQLLLGMATVYYLKPADVASAHVAVGALVLVTSFAMLLGAIRLYRPRSAAFEPMRDRPVRVRAGATVV